MMTVFTLHVNCVLTSIFVYKYVYTTVLSFDIVAVDEINVNSILSFIQGRHALDNKMIVGAIITDLSKAFDSLPHKLLIEKLKAYGLTKDARNLIETHLEKTQSQNWTGLQ